MMISVGFTDAILSLSAHYLLIICSKLSKYSICSNLIIPRRVMLFAPTTLEGARARPKSAAGAIAQALTNSTLGSPFTATNLIKKSG
jgi:hypothetical protein